MLLANHYKQTKTECAMMDFIGMCVLTTLLRGFSPPVTQAILAGPWDQPALKWPCWYATVSEAALRSLPNSGTSYFAGEFTQPHEEVLCESLPSRMRKCWVRFLTKPHEEVWYAWLR